MSAHTLLHLSVAAFCALFGVMHVLYWVALRPRERAALWIGFSFLGFASLDVLIAATSVAASGALGPASVYSPLVLASSLTLPFLLLSAWGVFGKPVTGVRRILLLLSLVVLGLTYADFGFWAPSMDPFTFERWYYEIPRISGWPNRLFGLVLTAVFLYEGVIASRDARRRVVGISAIVSATLATALVIAEMRRAIVDVSGPTWFGLTVVPYVVFGATAALQEFIRISQRARQPRSGDVDRYKLVKRLGAGGMGELWLAARIGPAGFERQVALKKMLLAKGAPDEVAIERFLAEARLAAALSHPNIVSVFDLGRIEGGWFIAMEYLAGISLMEIREMRKETGTLLPPALLAFVGEQTARGLAHAHARGVIHRDVSPQNVMITFDGIVKVVDFGIAKARGATDRPSSETPALSSGDLTEPGRVLGKTAYLSPEQLAENASTGLSDQFSLAVVLYELVNGKRPYAFQRPGGSPALEARGVVPLSVAVPEVPPALGAVIDRGFAFRPQDRHPSMEAFAAELASYRAGTGPETLAAWVRATFPTEWRSTIAAAAEATATLDRRASGASEESRATEAEGRRGDQAAVDADATTAAPPPEKTASKGS